MEYTSPHLTSPSFFQGGCKAPPTSYEAHLLMMRNNNWMFKYILLLSFFLCYFWGFQPSFLSSFKQGSTYSQNGLQLETFSAPFTCDPKLLPPRARMMRRTHESYVLLGHGFDDVVTNYNWALKGDDGWENDLAEEMNLYIETIKTMDPSRGIVLDIGANIGTHMLYLAARGYEVHGFEPTYANYVLAHCSLAISRLTGPIRFNHFGLGDKVETVCMDSNGGNMGDSKVDTTGHCDVTKQAKLDTLDNYYDRFLYGRKVALVKIDVQGFEVAALLHGTKLFDSANAPEAVFFEVEPANLKLQGADPRDLIQYFESRGYSVWHFGKRPEGTAKPDFINGTSIPWKDEHLSALEGLDGGAYDLIAVKKSWKIRAEEAGYRFTGGTLQ